MTDPMLEQQLSASTDTLSGIRIEESLNSQFNSPDQRFTDRKVGGRFPLSKCPNSDCRSETEAGDDVAIGVPELDIVDLNTITSESSGVVSGLTSSSPSSSSIHSARADMEEAEDRPATITYDRLKSAMVSGVSPCPSLIMSV